MSAAIDEARERYSRNDINWPASLLMELEDHQRGSGFNWVVACAMLLLEQTEVESRSALIQWVKDVAAAKEKGDLAGLREKSLEIWHARRDQLHTGVSHLYAALVHLLEGDSREYRRAIVYAIGAMCDDPAFSRTGLAIPLEAFRKMQPNRGGTS